MSRYEWYTARMARAELGSSVIAAEPEMKRRLCAAPVPSVIGCIPGINAPESAVPPRLDQSPSTAIFRPVQYLGSKLRSIEAILSIRNTLFNRPIVVLDPFVGSTVVAQAFSLNGDTMICSDALSFCNHIATAILGIGITGDHGLAAHLKEFLAQEDRRGLQLFGRWLGEETVAMQRRNSETLMEVSFNVPQIWRTSGATAPLLRHFENLSAKHFKSAIGHGPIIASFYAGTYFGIRQALDIDALSCAIHSARQRGQLTPWEFSVFVTALCSAASACVFSAGKHFAQPYLSGPSKTTAFAHKRILEDRGVCVKTAFQSAVQQTVAAARAHHRNHSVLWSPFESFASRVTNVGTVNLIYADPPYTAQQYSRFYHILETLAVGQIPDVQAAKGAPTRGIYPSNRYKSPFCSKTAAPAAFAQLLATAARLQSSILLSYSLSGHLTGNDRMITLDDILNLDLIKSGQFKPTVHEFSHQFRTFNPTEVEGASDTEVLIVLKYHAAKIPRQ